jgi:ABC-type nitrate/sulfonate/bicarbonate transport system substrate-binding protein
MTKLDTLWYTRCGVPTAVGIAVQLGWLEQEFASDGITIASIRDAALRDVRQSHYDHSQKHSFRQGGSIPAIWARASGRDTRLVGLTWTNEAQVILALPQSGIRTVKDLKGRRLGIATRPDDVIDFWAATTERVYELALETAGLSLRDVELVCIAQQGNSFDRPAGSLREPLEVEALKSGSVDVIFHKGSRGLEIAHGIGAHVVFDTWKVPEVRVRANNHSPRTLTVDGELADQHPEIVARIVKRALLAGEWAEAHPREAVAYVARETGSAERWVRSAYGDEVHRHLGTNLEESSIGALADFITFLYERGYLPTHFDVGAWIDTRPLTQARRLLARSGLRVVDALAAP